MKDPEVRLTILDIELVVLVMIFIVNLYAPNHDKRACSDGRVV